ncbi:UPF0223 family protein [Agrilactobacillus yilanensis]|uniref:UPF0223 protein ACFQ5M_03580 n=1 Tax=Agrilactobacillus yilanensis TaxID=2485997 RepID=A0ABW4J5E8_9LACO|nr:UPF0223 family protein [Agrilactobacillus yilanensis]
MLKIAETNYSYPLDTSWTTEEIIVVIGFYNNVEKANEKGITKQDLLASYEQFKKIVPSKMQEKQLGKQFETVSGYSIYQTVQAAKQSQNKIILMKKGL